MVCIRRFMVTSAKEKTAFHRQYTTEIRPWHDSNFPVSHSPELTADLRVGPGTSVRARPRPPRSGMVFAPARLLLRHADCVSVIGMKSMVCNLHAGCKRRAGQPGSRENRSDKSRLPALSFRPESAGKSLRFQAVFARTGLQKPMPDRGGRGLEEGGDCGGTRDFRRVQAVRIDFRIMRSVMCSTRPGARRLAQ